MKSYLYPLGIWILFEIIAVSLWLTQDNIFYLYNFTYIGSWLALGIYLYSQKIKYARKTVQFAVGSYMLVYLGFFSHENIQLEGFWYYLFLGVFGAAVIHYAVAKIFGPLFFGRGWCGYACWTAMILDLLPYEVPQQPRKRIGFIRYIMFLASILFVVTVLLVNYTNTSQVMLWSFIIGNVLYYVIGITLAIAFKDNRAFCKYICPITVFLKPASYFSLLRVKNDQEKCVDCGKCKTVCPMNVDMTDNSRKRLNGTECILCLKCVDECPAKALYL
ncbi:MAG TPA: 4Fe-4S dicluster domain-containing protein [Syntrophomonadaceae bacterium]|nr:4Fe-4S dicluster domain-containing protein [Syntrophomonadaceae bacterium]HPU49469.1 4Fe-4S dicluster domain-containing protein [Syntrophomonadaceae bacterium]